ncbi:hypothetical protein HID58_060303, partial [Brassica napus]
LIHTANSPVKPNFPLQETISLTSSLSSSSSSSTTLFAIDDSSLFNTSSLPPLFLKQLLQYHTLPLRLPMEELLKKPQGTCLPTLLRHQSVQISSVDKESRRAEVNHVMISHPDMFLGDSLFLDPSHLCYLTWIIFHGHLCVNLTQTKPLSKKKKKKKKLCRIIADQHKNLTGVTILATPNLVSLSSASPLLYEVMRRHILAQRLTKKDLASMPDKALLKTLDPYQDLIITRRGIVNSSQCFMISGVEIVAPDMFSSNNFVIHGISHTLELPRA